jgi:hypothetical protein
MSGGNLGDVGEIIGARTAAAASLIGVDLLSPTSEVSEDDRPRRARGGDVGAPDGSNGGTQDGAGPAELKMKSWSEECFFASGVSVGFGPGLIIGT